jgi:hypothetical protein
MFIDERKKNVLFLCQYFYPEYISSAMLPFQTAQVLVKSELTVGVLTGVPKEYVRDDEKISKKEVVDGIEIHRKRYCVFDRKKKIGRILNYFSFLCSMILNIFYFRRYKVVIVYSNPPLVVMFIRKLRFVWELFIKRGL